MAARGADLLVDRLIELGVGYMFTLSGNQILSVFDATIGRDIELIHTRHEAAAVHMADAWGRLTDTPGVALLTAGPGHCNGLSALYVALMEESPVVMLSGQSPLAQKGRGAFQEIDQVAMASQVTKASWAVGTTYALPLAVGRAFDIATSGRPGPVHLSLPSDVLEGPALAQTPEDITDEGSGASGNLSGKILDSLDKSERPLILAGPAMGRGNRWSGVEKLSEITGIPALPMESPRGINDPWLHRATNRLSEADLVLLAGKKLDFSLKFGESPFFDEHCRFIQIEADEHQLVDSDAVLPVLCDDPSRVIEALSESFGGSRSDWQSWKTDVMRSRQSRPEEWTSRSGDGIHPLDVCVALEPYLGANGVIVSDGGEFGQWVQAGIEADIRLINGPSGAIGSGLPMALAAKLVDRSRDVFVFLGDGTFGFHALELETAVRYDIPVVVIVGNDARWNAEHQLQIENYGSDRTVGCDLLPARYDRLAEALGGVGEQVDRADEIAPAVDRAVASGLPAVINVAIQSVGAPVFR